MWVQHHLGISRGVVYITFLRMLFLCLVPYLISSWRVRIARGYDLLFGNKGSMSGFLNLYRREDATVLARKCPGLRPIFLERSRLSTECKEKVVARGDVWIVAFL